MCSATGVVSAISADIGIVGFLMDALHSLGTGLMGAAPAGGLATPLVPFHVAVVVAMTCASLPLLAVDMATASPPARKRVPLHSFMLMGMRFTTIVNQRVCTRLTFLVTASLGSALLGSLLLGVCMHIVGILLQHLFINLPTDDNGLCGRPHVSNRSQQHTWHPTI